MRLIVLTEEKSMAQLLRTVLPKALPHDVRLLVIPHNGKSDLKKSIPIKLKGWNIPDDVFLIVQDQDSNDCMKVKNELLELAEPYGKTFLVRIACRELESWYWGDLTAVSQAYNKNVEHLSNKSSFRVPDQIVNPKNEFLKLFPNHQQISGAETISEFMEIERNTSQSFQTLISGALKLVSNAV